MAAEGRACDYCGLPTAPTVRGWFTGRQAARESDSAKHYCCFGCRFAAAVADERQAAGQVRWTLTRLGVAIFFTMNVMVFTLALWTNDVYPASGAESEVAAAASERIAGAESLFWQLFRYLALIFSAPVLLLLGGPLLENALASLARGRPNSDLLLAIGVAAAFAYSAVSVVRGAGHVYFEVACVVLTALTLGRWLEASAKVRTTSALESLHKLLPDRVAVLRDGQEISLARGEVTVGDLIRVRAGERVAADGVLEVGQAHLDQQSLTGESEPALKEPGDAMFAGALNLDGDLVIRVSKAPGESAMDRLAAAVKAAANAKGRYQRLADRVSAVFTPAVMAVAAMTFAWRAAAGDWESALLSSLAVLLIACPCALGLATPLAIWAALARAAQEHLLFRDADALTRLCHVTLFCFDKTGTLTEPQAAVVSFLPGSPTERRQAMSVAVSLASATRHGLSQSITRWAADRYEGALGETARMPIDVQAVAGRGVAGRMGPGEPLCRLGSPRFMEESGLTAPPLLAEAIDKARCDGLSLVCVGYEGEVRGVFLFREQVRPSARPVLGALAEQGRRAVVLTGDHALRGDAIARDLHVEVRAELLPQDKERAVAGYRSAGETVAMVGDGVNDAAALAVADVGVAMACGADISRDTAAVCLLSDELEKLPWAIELSRRTTAIVRQNLFWAFAYNIVGIGLAVAGWLNPMLAAVAMGASSLMVIVNSLRLNDFGRQDGALALHRETSVPAEAADSPAPATEAFAEKHQASAALALQELSRA